MIGKTKLISLPEEDAAQINHLLESSGLLPLRSTKVESSLKARISGSTFFAKENRRVKKSNSFTIAFVLQSDATLHYGFIERFLVANDTHVALIQELDIVRKGPQNGVPESIATISSQALMFEDYLTYKEGTHRYIFTHQIKYLCCNLSNSSWKLLTTLVNDTEVE